MMPFTNCIVLSCPSITLGRIKYFRKQTVNGYLKNTKNRHA